MQHIAIAGNIGAGKTTLASKLAHHYDWEISYESVEDNPYLKDFYADMPRWSFHLQMYFLHSRFRQVVNAKQSSKTTIQDRTIYEDAYVFARNLFESGLMSERDYQNYYGIFDSMMRFVSPPDLLIYLRADLPKLRKQIDRRGRDFESAIQDSYLLNLNTHYENWINGYAHHILILDTNERDFVQNIQDWYFLITQIDDSLKKIMNEK